MRQNLLKKIEELKQKIDDLRPLSPGEVKEIRKWYDVSYTYNSNAIEGNTLTLGQTKMIIEDGLTVGGKQIKEILEVKNHKNVLDKLFDIAKNKNNISEKLILEFHEILLLDIDQENAEKYRKIQVYISGSEEKLPTAKRVPALMKNFLDWYAKDGKKLSPVVLAILFHYKFVKIHPFIDGNGRMARLLLNLILLRAGYPPIIVPVIRRQEYINAIQAGEDAFVDFMLEIVEVNLEDYLRMVEF
ncbi:MAG: Fic family protein [bacterium]